MLHNAKMNVIETASNGIVNHETIFQFEQDNDLVKAHYSGGKIKQGYLVGYLKDDILTFTYCQARVSGEMDHGSSSCSFSIENGKRKLVESFEMTTGDELAIGVNVFMEL